jgi:hypothetical protein
VIQVLQLQLWPPLRDLSTDIIRDNCLSVFKPEELPAGHTLLAAGSLVSSDANASKLYLLVQGSVLCGVPAIGTTPAAESERRAASDLHAGFVVTEIVRSSCPGMALMLGLESLANAQYRSTRVCK